jgi:hypothetical protein
VPRRCASEVGGRLVARAATFSAVPLVGAAVAQTAAMVTVAVFWTDAWQPRVAAAPSESCARTVRRLLVKSACEDASRKCIRHLGFQQVDKRDRLFLFLDVQEEVLQLADPILCSNSCGQCVEFCRDGFIAERMACSTGTFASRSGRLACSDPYACYWKDPVMGVLVSVASLK